MDLYRRICEQERHETARSILHQWSKKNFEERERGVLVGEDETGRPGEMLVVTLTLQTQTCQSPSSILVAGRKRKKWAFLTVAVVYIYIYYFSYSLCVYFTVFYSYKELHCGYVP